MPRFLVELGVPDGPIVSEGASNSTVENIFSVRKMVGDKPVALVTSGYHMPRAHCASPGVGRAQRLGLSRQFPCAALDAPPP